MEHLSLVRNEIITFLINLVEVLWCGTDIYPTPSWFFLIEYNYDFIDVIYHVDLDIAAFSLVNFCPEVVVNLVLVDGHVS